MTYLSMVTTARNDDYGGNQIHRMRCFLDSVLAFSERYSADVEVIIVEWNPPENEPLLEEELENNFPESDTDVRFIRVPEEIHNSLPNSDEMPLFEYLAKNAGIRRAEGEFVLSTNPDLVYNEDFFRFIANEKLNKDSYYRMSRRDVDKLVSIEKSVDERVQECRENTYRILKNHRTVDLREKSRLIEFMKTAIAKMRFDRRELRDIGISKLLGRKYSLLNLHCSASGDFLLSARENWDEVRGYPEVDVNFNIDSYGVLNMAALGLKSNTLSDPLRIYHMEHERYHDERPEYDWDELVEKSREMLREKEPDIVNGENWGLRDEELEEVKL